MPVRGSGGQRYWFKGLAAPGIRKRPSGGQKYWFRGNVFRPIVPLSHACTIDITFGLSCVGTVEYRAAIDIDFNLEVEAQINQVVCQFDFNLSCVPVVTQGCTIPINFNLEVEGEVSSDVTAAILIDFDLVARTKINATKESCLTGDGTLPEPETIAAGTGKKNLCF